MSKIPRAPEHPPVTSPSDPRFYDARDLEAELRRTFQICHECRMCVNFCGSFPELFARVDREIESGRAEGAETLDYDDFKVVGDACWQCKLCYIKCPYTKDEGAYEMLDYPRVMAREKANRAKRDGVSFVDRILGEPHTMGAAGAGLFAPASNFVATHRLLRKVQEKATGISAEFPLPSFASETFPHWKRKHRASHEAGAAGKVVLFATCYGNYNMPAVPRAATLVLEHLGYDVITVDETCCGMPNLDGGDVERCVEKIRHNVAALLPHVRAGAKVLIPQPTCGMLVKNEWLEYVDEPDVKEVVTNAYDLMEFLDGLRKLKQLPIDFVEGAGTVAYHAACHLRAQKIGFPAARLLARLPETTVRTIQECSAVDGTWGMKAAHYETGRRYAQSLVRAVDEEEAEVVVSDCGLSALRIGKENGVRVQHPIQILARAYGLSDE